MKIRTIWESQADGDMPWLVAAVDEYTIEEHGEIPGFYAKELTPTRRELIITIPESDVVRLFQAPTVKGKVVEE